MHTLCIINVFDQVKGAESYLLTFGSPANRRAPGCELWSGILCEVGLESSDTEFESENLEIAGIGATPSLMRKLL